MRILRYKSDWIFVGAFAIIFLSYGVIFWKLLIEPMVYQCEKWEKRDIMLPGKIPIMMHDTNFCVKYK